jgi:hypothetical protein
MEQKHYFDMLKEARHKLGHDGFRALVLQVEDDAVTPQTTPIPTCGSNEIYDARSGKCIKDPGIG